MLADQVGVDVIALGEHHRPEYSVSSPETVLAAIAARTVAPPPRLRRDRAQLRRPGARLPALRHRSTRSPTGAREVILGRGSFTESFPLFGYDLADYDVLFEEKIELFSRLLDRAAGHLVRHHAPGAARTPTSSPRPSPAG